MPCFVFVPVMLFAQTPFDGPWKTNMAQSNLSQKPFVYSVTNGMYECESCVPKIEVKADGQDQPVTGQTYDTIAVEVVDANTIHLTGKKAGKIEFEATRTASQDGKMLTASRTDYPIDGSQPVKVEVKWTRFPRDLRARMRPPVLGGSKTSMKTPPGSPAPGTVSATG
jgi:hypothetical protein